MNVNVSNLPVGSGSQTLYFYPPVEIYLLLVTSIPPPPRRWDILSNISLCLPRDSIRCCCAIFLVVSRILFQPPQDASIVAKKLTLLHICTYITMYNLPGINICTSTILTESTYGVHMDGTTPIIACKSPSNAAHGYRG